ncbi:unnamed protein product [Paramecium primaurelia]|uniref:Uncharacterized protein n=1 Tax=Paramecium primaurelia TaxID=5886 RepID=A0A8S1LJM0_PARPR|nr:unnamed protein product [Paramecium primaurelia]
MSEIVSNQLFVTGYSLAKISDEKDIKNIFKKYGTIKNVAYKGSYSFVTFSSESEAENALKTLNGQQINGQKLIVNVVDNRKGRRNGPQENDECFRCKKGGHWARECPNESSPKRRKYDNQRSRYRKTRRSNSRSHSQSSYQSSHSRGQRNSKKGNRYSRRSRSPKRDQKRQKNTSQKRSNTNSSSRSLVNNRQRQSHRSSLSK